MIEKSCPWEGRQWRDHAGAARLQLVGPTIDQPWSMLGRRRSARWAGRPSWLDVDLSGRIVPVRRERLAPGGKAPPGLVAAEPSPSAWSRIGRGRQVVAQVERVVVHVIEISRAACSCRTGTSVARWQLATGVGEWIQPYWSCATSLRPGVGPREDEERPGGRAAGLLAGLAPAVGFGVDGGAKIS